MSRNLITLGLFAAVLAGPVFAETTATTATAAPVACEDQFKAMDTDNNGSLSETEAAQVYAKARLDNMTIPATGYGRDEFLAACADNQYTRKEPEAGAPLAGANSFTEGQAKDRAIAWGVSGVSALAKDDKGVWRGTGMVDGGTVNVAIDYKGNVVTTK